MERIKKIIVVIGLVFSTPIAFLISIPVFIYNSWRDTDLTIADFFRAHKETIIDIYNGE